MYSWVTLVNGVIRVKSQPSYMGFLCEGKRDREKEREGGERERERRRVGGGVVWQT